MNDKLAKSLKNTFSKAHYSLLFLDRVARSGDASFFKQIPQAVVFPENEKQINDVIRISHELNLPITFRAGATSLSGQTLGSGLIVDITRGFRKYKINEDGSKAEFEPAIVSDHANLFLKPYGKKLGPDPASGKACMIGGIVANNASGITSGTNLNPYKTIHSMRFILPSGTIVDTSKKEANEKLEVNEPELCEFLRNLKKEIQSDADSVEKINRLYRLKNTVGYSINSFIDYDLPVEMLSHLMIGSEGTLGFISSVTFNTVDDKPLKSAVLLGFDELEKAGEAVIHFSDAGMAAVEIIDSSALNTIRDLAGMPAQLAQIPLDGAALLIEAHAADEKALHTLKANADKLINELRIEITSGFMDEEVNRLKLWKARKSLFATVGANRPEGTTVITEDVVVPKEKLTETILSLTQLLKKHDFYDEAVIFGHAKDGSLHFNFPVHFGIEKSRNDFKSLSDDLADLICIDMQGALKGEHGTGRAVVGYVEKQWGEKIAGWMREIKMAIDPDNLFNPGVLIDLSGNGHPENYKESPSVDQMIDKCVECGFCEPHCPSRELTLSPRQRIMVQREIAMLEDKSSRKLKRALEDQFNYSGEETCAVDGLCQINCPVDINTGDYIKSMRKTGKGKLSAIISRSLLDHWYGIIRLGKIGFDLGHTLASVFGYKSIYIVSIVLNRISGRNFPVWNRFIPIGQKIKSRGKALINPDFIYFPSCINSMMGMFPGETPPRSVVQSVMNIAQLAGLAIAIPQEMKHYCCGLPMSSKGYDVAFKYAAKNLTSFLYEQSDGGRIPVIVDTSPCTQTILHYDTALEGVDLEKWKKLRFIDIVEFLHDEIIQKSPIKQLERNIAVHPVCSVIRMELEGKLNAIAQACADKVADIPVTGCCGTAGDRGWRYPELTDSATKIEASYVKKSSADYYYSTSRTCESGMSKASNRPYQSIVFLVEDALQSGEDKIKENE